MQRAVVPAFRSFPSHYRQIALRLAHPSLFVHIPIVINDDVCIHQLKPGPDGARKYLFVYAPFEAQVRNNGSAAQLQEGTGGQVSLISFPE